MKLPEEKAYLRQHLEKSTYMEAGQRAMSKQYPITLYEKMNLTADKTDGEK